MNNTLSKQEYRIQFELKYPQFSYLGLLDLGNKVKWGSITRLHVLRKDGVYYMVKQTEGIKTNTMTEPKAIDWV